jgi:hypothetical protein
VCRQERVVQREAGDLVAEHQPGVVIEAKVLPGVDPAQTGLFRRCTEAREGAGHAGSTGEVTENRWSSP